MKKMKKWIWLILMILMPVGAEAAIESNVDYFTKPIAASGGNKSWIYQSADADNIEITDGNKYTFIDTVALSNTTSGVVLYTNYNSTSSTNDFFVKTDSAGHFFVAFNNGESAIIFDSIPAEPYSIWNFIAITMD